MRDIDIGLCWGTVSQADIPQLIELAARHGFPTITVPPDWYIKSRDAGLTANAIRRQLADAQITVRVIDGIAAGLPGVPTGDIRFRDTTLMRADAETCLEVADALEAPFVNVAPFQGTPVPRAEMAEAIGTICRKAAEYGVSAVVECMPDSSIVTLAEGDAIARACGEPNCSILLDTWHWARTGGTIQDVKALPPGAIGAMQLSDRIAPPPGEAYVPMSGRKLPGEGELPLGEAVSAALANNPAITIEIEVFDAELRALPADEAAARAAAAVRRWRDGLESG